MWVHLQSEMVGMAKSCSCLFLQTHLGLHQTRHTDAISLVNGPYTAELSGSVLAWILALWAGMARSWCCVIEQVQLGPKFQCHTRTNSFVC